jgi:predicted nucleic acid-binding protein
MYYFDSAYVAKCYLNDPDSEAVRDLVRAPAPLYSSALCIPEVTSAIHRRHSSRLLSRRQALELAARFRLHAEGGTWTFVPLTESLLWEAHESLRTLPPGVAPRAGDAVHLVSARLAGFFEIWTNDRHMLDAARQFGLIGRSV